MCVNFKNCWPENKKFANFLPYSGRGLQGVFSSNKLRRYYRFNVNTQPNCNCDREQEIACFIVQDMFRWYSQINIITYT